MKRITREILGMRVDATSYSDATKRILNWASSGESRYVCVANVHMVMESYDSPIFKKIVNQADLITPDGTPLVWALRFLGISNATRVYGPTLTLHLCQAASEQGVPIALYGGTDDSLDSFVCFLKKSFRGIKIVCQIAPPFRPLTSEEDLFYSQKITESGAGITLVGIGCPKQEKWIAKHKGRIPSVMVGVGAAFDFHSGRVKQAPAWLQQIGMEWFFRMTMEPRRLWKRYLWNNPRFVGFFIRQYFIYKSQCLLDTNYIRRKISA